MKTKTIKLAEQLLSSVPKSDTVDLIHLLQYYNRFPEDQRVLGMRVGAQEPLDPALEKEVQRVVNNEVIHFSASQDVYMVSTQTVCRCCGK